MQESSEFEKFIENIIQDKGFTDLLPEVHEALKKDLIARVDDFIVERVIAALSDEDLKKFEMLIKEHPDEQNDIQQFASKHIPDFTNFLAATLMEFRDVYLAA